MIAILRYNAGNILSVQNALNRLGQKSIITDDPLTLRTADKVIFPGVGEAGSAMAYLKEKGLDQLIPDLTQPVLGICLGMQLMCRSSEEGQTSGLGIFAADVKRFPPKDKVPHMGWNNLSAIRGSLLQGVRTDDDVYFVHGFYAPVCDETVAQCDYITPFSAALEKDNFYATQFHPEKSAGIGETILKNFLAL